MFRRSFWLSLSIIALMVFPSMTTAQASEIPKPPLVSSPIVDETGTFTKTQIKEISQAVGNPEKSDGRGELAIYMTNNIPNNKTIEEASLDVARSWGIGSKSKDGVLLYIAKADREIRIEVADTATIELTDSLASRIIRENAKTYLSDGKDQYFEAVKAISTDIKSTFQGQPPTYEESETGAGTIVIIVLIIAGFCLIVLPLMVFIFSLIWSFTPIGRSSLKRKYVGHFGYAADNALSVLMFFLYIVFAALESGGSSSSGSSGGRSTGGGGGFSGGGASGRF